VKRFAVIGLGRFGTKLAVDLATSGAEVIAIDKGKEEIEALRDLVSCAVRLDSTDEAALRAQGVDKVDVAIVSIGQAHGQGFEAAILTVVNLKQLGVPVIYTRAEDPIAGEVFSKVGATAVIYPEIESAQRWAFKLLAPHVEDRLDFAPGYSLARVKASAKFNGKTVRDLQLRQKYNVNLVAITRAEHAEDGANAKEEMVNVPLPDTVVYKDDILILAGKDTDLARLPQE
jgi:trk system potassium uptake protein TrkA